MTENGLSRADRELFLCLLANSRDRVASARILRNHGRRLTACECAHVGLEIAIKALFCKHSIKAARTHNLTELTNEIRRAIDQGNAPNHYRKIQIDLVSQFATIKKQYWNPSHRYTKREIKHKEFGKIMKSLSIADSILEKLN